jgi:hypothetical protein
VAAQTAENIRKNEKKFFKRERELVPPELM